MTAMLMTMMMAGSLVVPAVDAQVRQSNQGGRGRQGMELPAGAPGMPVQQLQELFDAFVLVQAQRVLQLNDEEYQRFFPAMKRLQDTRRSHQQQRQRLLGDMRRAAPFRPAQNARPDAPPPADEATLTALLRRSDELETRLAEELREVRKALDETLPIRQRVAFRIFEEDMERQKLDYITRARQQQGPGRQGGG